MSEEYVTLEVLAASLFEDFLNNLIHQQTLNCLSRHKTIALTVDNGPLEGVQPYNKSDGKDIFGQDKQKLKTSETSRYFICDNCGRKIAGGRFALHMNKCLERRRG